MTPTDFYRLVAKSADTPGLQINQAVVSRVLSVAFGNLADMPAHQCAATVANCLTTAAAKRNDEAQG